MSNADKEKIKKKYLLIKQDVQHIVDAVKGQVLNDPGRQGYRVEKNKSYVIDYQYYIK